ncbi:MAG: Heat-inducible transcription repressor HrcA [Candidatus Tokpelaia sp. JSC085]|nr:MAG: Heat-inducible transcription repressor HrcA [Candidatus Tokpelaia sp. JSC085]
MRGQIRAELDDLSQKLVEAGLAVLSQSTFDQPARLYMDGLTFLRIFMSAMI